MLSLEEKIKAAAENAVLKHIEGGVWLAQDYSTRFKVPEEWMVECWKLVDKDRLRKQLTERLEAELADRMVNHMAAELATDVKQILSVKERREMLRGLAREHMESIMKAGESK